MTAEPPGAPRTSGPGPSGARMSGEERRDPTAAAGRADLAAMAAAIERLAVGLALGEEPGGFAAALEAGAPGEPGAPATGGAPAAAEP